MMSRSLRAETRSRGKEDTKRPMQALDKVRRWEKKWITIHDTTMKIYKWVPVISDDRKKKNSSSNKENRMCSRDSSMSAFHMGGDDSNTAMSMMSDSQDATDFSSSQFNISEDSNSEPPFKKKLAE
ncbi:B-cell CLL/lymphoma 7 protein family member A [Penaeus vannamei]|uniref:B-cell CLL/lymphoma 7 protein family member A n=1 Tax=Penaeus vannamei TaxID=6689 RepID=UPI000F65D0F8|nr:B-cell CLL/lymphoma 7 protein family member A-like [Penaeus vannamei]XP_037779729.1 B-cell CLL/lymphoma 7 protein family member A-like [Penaeus monodon]XP_042883506.1 B-cell CLL/lymphoma 7 protein family member A-like [Penaeus japonicus]XP_047476617.1 B-cell CLL/lymphoma 7 protein family member A-like [Penaeus chinensis]